MARLTTAQRNALPDSDFAGPGRSFPIEDATHARNALARGAQNAGPKLQGKIKGKVERKFPKIDVASPRMAAVKNIAKKAGM